ncbi:MAG: anhydro-N-acetylmuramic acid kinase [Flavobacteriaceae bacterium]|nr:anhydro-N-acetylmuramic acid kinase [Flavobacteriaceae bacterium]
MSFEKRFAIGLMSGTSLDGVDLVYVSFEKKENYSFKIIHSKTYFYTDDWKQKLQQAFNQSEEKVSKIDIEYGKYLGTLINIFTVDYQIDTIEFIASHGHTIFHNPNEGITLQIGNGKIISKITNHKVVCDFRTQDVKLGGQGAPLVPIGDQLLFSEYRYCLNLGGFANISFEENYKRIAFDICPVNIVMNHYTQKLGLEYDDKGLLASEGKINHKLLNELNNLPFYIDDNPKSLGFEFIVDEIFPLIDNYNLLEKDVLRTFVEHVVIQISNKIKSKGKLLITGGGTFNTFLIDALRKRIPNQIITPKKEIIDFKEALIFAFLGLLRVDNQVNCLKSVTGAKKDHSSGQIYVP